MELYSELIIDLYKNPLNKRAIGDAQIKASGANVTCGDRFRLYAKIDAAGIIKDCSFEGDGCAISVAAAALVTEEAKGKTPAQIAAWGSAEIFEWLGTELGPARIKCGLISLETLQKGLHE